MDGADTGVDRGCCLGGTGQASSLGNPSKSQLLILQLIFNVYFSGYKAPVIKFGVYV